MNKDLILKLEELLEEIKTWPEIVEIKRLETIIDKKYKQLINEFNEEKAKFEEVYQYGKHHPDYYQTLKSFGQIKENLYNKEEVKNYFLLTDQVRIKLQEIINTIATTISPTGFNKEGITCEWN